jgi:hypothetical protein
MSIGKLPTIKTSKGPTMADYKSGAAVSRGVKLKAMAGGGNVTVPPGRQPTSPIWKSVPPTLPSGASRQSVSPPISKASAPLVAVSPFAAGGKVIRGQAAEREMARMEKEAKVSGNQRLPKKG